ncbi:H+ Antiporter protein [Piscirickettsia salmonis]|uniref:H+ Antiporter protein n=2 Tax=Piscirickettsia salmonis TaxID=1238 RepID=A0A9Q6LI80_PISSA|nr:MFS transporter [Piscirickettsia salmonis]ALA24240.1 major Facilitator Superfamily protein [Piscirickettsia salmonis]QGN95872.1 H+ Antiporter protein [Piscirickettsia salmonis]QGO05177.1 H+ Antiporter protein [Piscirickettsia salmonis]QGO33498.1 H+ Antiporter protein [Piscirickettsia salmonis]QGO37110.1 H+ Antiporter protein [Piscirickettsia salmonis]
MEAIRLVKKSAIFRVVLALSFLESFALMMDFTVLYTVIVYLWKLPLYKVILFSFTVSIPSIIISPFAGRLVDAKGSITCIQYSSILCFFLTIGLIFTNSYFILFALVFIRSSLKTVFFPALSRIIKLTVDKKQLLSVNSLIQFNANGLLIIAPIIGMVVFSTLGKKWCFLITSILFFLTFGLSFFLKEVSDKCSKIAMGPLSQGDLDIKKLLVPFLGMIIAAFAIYLGDSLFPVLLKSIGLDFKDFALIGSFFGIGGMAASIFCQCYKNSNEVTLIKLGATLVIISMFTYGAFSSMLSQRVFFVFAMLNAGGITLISISSATLLQKNTPTHMMGKVSSINTMIFGLASIIIPMLGLTFSQLVSVKLPFLLLSIITLGILLIMQYFNLSTSLARKKSQKKWQKKSIN